MKIELNYSKEEIVPKEYSDAGKILPAYWEAVTFRKLNNNEYIIIRFNTASSKFSVWLWAVRYALADFIKSIIIYPNKY